MLQCIFNVRRFREAVNNHFQLLRSLTRTVKYRIVNHVGIKLLQGGGIEVAIITGRNSDVVTRRARELGIERVIQGRNDKLAALQEMLASLPAPVDMSEVAYMGDDLPDLAAIRACGLGMTVAGADAFVAAHADWRSQLPGGRGAVREACEFILQAQGKLDTARERFLAPGAT